MRLEQFAASGRRAARARGAKAGGTRPCASATCSAASSVRPPGSTVMHQNVTVAEAIVLSCFDLKPPRNRIVFEAGLFPSVRYVQQAWSRFGAEVVVCDDADAVIDAIDERTLLVPISHVLFKTAEIQPIERIVERAHEAGAHVCLDAYQSAGAVPLDVTELGIAFCVGGSVKWLCGGPGRRVALRAARPRRAAGAGVRGLAGARAAVRLRGRDGACAAARRASSPARRSSPRTTPRAPVTRSSRRSASIASARTRCARPRCSSS